MLVIAGFDEYNLFGPGRVEEINRVTKRKRPPHTRTRTPAYEATLAEVRRIVLGFIAVQRVAHFHKENLARLHGLDPGKVQRALGKLRNDGLVHRPITNPPACDTWRGGRYDEYSAWAQTQWHVRLPGYEVRFNTLSGPRGRWEHAKVAEP